MTNQQKKFALIILHVSAIATLFIASVSLFSNYITCNMNLNSLLANQFNDVKKNLYEVGGSISLILGISVLVCSTICFLNLIFDKVALKVLSLIASLDLIATSVIAVCIIPNLAKTTETIIENMQFIDVVGFENLLIPEAAALQTSMIQILLCSILLIVSGAFLSYFNKKEV